MSSILTVPRLSFTDIIRRHGLWQSRKIAVVCDQTRLTWGVFDQRTSMVANALLDSGLKKGDKVALFLRNSIETLELIVGIIRAGGVAVPLNILMAGPSISSMIRGANATFVVVGDRTIDQFLAHGVNLDEIALDRRVLVGASRDGWMSYEKWIASASSNPPVLEIDLQDTMSIVYSSGTTGGPKGIEHTHFARLTYCLGFGLGLGISTRSVTALTTPLYTNGTWMTMMPTLFAGGTLVIMDKFDGAQFFRLVEEQKCTHAFMVPTQFIMTMAVSTELRRDTNSLSVLVCSGSPLSFETFKEIRRQFPSAELYEVYGMTEGFSTLIGASERNAAREMSVGLPILDGDIRIIDDHDREVLKGEIGEVVGYSSSLMKGYFGDAVKTKELMWCDTSGRSYIRSGDLGRLDADGYLFIVGRKKDMIISGGVNIYSIDIEEVFMKHPEVSEVAVIGVPHPKWGETPMAFAILKAGVSISPDDLREWANARLASFQKVTAVEICDELPRNALGKVLKRELRDLYSSAPPLFRVEGKQDVGGAA